MADTVSLRMKARIGRERDEEGRAEVAGGAEVSVWDGSKKASAVQQRAALVRRPGVLILWLVEVPTQRWAVGR